VKLAVKLEIKFQYESTYAWTECGKKETPHKLQSRKKKEKRDRPPPLDQGRGGSSRPPQAAYPTTITACETPRQPLGARAASVARRACGEGSLGRQECDSSVFVLSRRVDDAPRL
jgi:hypothetical protein